MTQKIKATIQKVSPSAFRRNDWTNGTVGDYVFQAQVFAEGSIYGINDGRVSRLSIYKKGNWAATCIINYDRGWDVKPTEETKPYFDAVMTELLKK